MKTTVEAETIRDLQNRIEALTGSNHSCLLEWNAATMRMQTVAPVILERGKYHLFTDEDGERDWEWFAADIDCDECVDAVIVRADSLCPTPPPSAERHMEEQPDGTMIPIDPSEMVSGERVALVTQESALAAIDYMDASNAAGRASDAIAMLAPSAEPKGGEREALIAYLRRFGPYCNISMHVKEAADMLAADAQELEQTCNCRFVGDVNTQQCTLHNAWAETLHEQAGYRKERDMLLAEKAQQVAVPQELEGEHSPAELRQMLDESFAEKKKAYFAIGQYQKAIENLIKERDAQQVAVPREVMQALDRMCTPLHESRLRGATADADARNMKIIRDYVLAAAPQPPQAALVPMTEESLETMSRKFISVRGEEGNHHFAFIDYARAIEARHGIGVKP